LWTEKYRPTTVDELAADQEVKNFLVEVICKQDIPNMLLYGRPGTGKNSIVNVILNNIRCSKLVINASEERGIDTIRDKVLAFATSAAWGNTLKIVVLNEADGLNYTAQDSLRELMETSSKYCRFILTCNSINRINDAIRSRCAEFETHIEPIDAAKRLVEILDNEEVNYTEDYILGVVKKFGSDLRKIINESQKLYTIHKKLDISVLKDTVLESYYRLFDQIFRKASNVKEVAKLTNKMILDENVYTSLKNYFIENYDIPDSIIVIADHAYKSRIVVDRDLVFLSCVITLKEMIDEVNK
jgi:DNA polymerase III delta prime subunit